MDATPEAILDFAAKVAQTAWDDQKLYNLADLAPDLKDAGIDYKSVLRGQRLRAFLEGEPNKIKVIFHPTQKANIRLIPPDKDYTWPAEPVAASPTTSSSAGTSAKIVGSKRQYIVSSFLKLVSELSEDEAQQVQIPLHILTKLMRDR